MIIQQYLKHDPWKMLIGCILLNQTHNRQVWPIIDPFFKRFPTPESISENNFEEIRDLIRGAGFYNRRAKSIINFTKAWIEGFNDVSELPGIGKYAKDSYEIFINENTNVEVTDKVLTKYLNGEFINQENEDYVRSH